MVYVFDLKVIVCFSHICLHLGCRVKNCKGLYHVNYGSRQSEEETTVHELHHMDLSKTFPSGHLQVVPWSAEPLGGRDSADSVQGELLPGEEQPDLPERLLALTQVDTLAHTLTPAASQINISIPHVSIKSYLLHSQGMSHLCASCFLNHLLFMLYCKLC